MTNIFRILTAIILIVLLLPTASFCKSGKPRDHRFQETSFAMETNPQWRALRNGFGSVNVREGGDTGGSGSLSRKPQTEKECGNLKDFLRDARKTAMRPQKTRAKADSQTLVRKFRAETESAELKQMLEDAARLR